MVVLCADGPMIGAMSRSENKLLFLAKNWGSG